MRLRQLIGKGALTLAATLLILGCGSGARGISGHCRYGVSRGHSDTEIHCKSRPQPKPVLATEAATAVPMTLALKRFEKTHRHASVSAVGTNWWGETSFTIDTGGSGSGRYQLVTYDSAGRSTKGNAGYVYDHFSRPFPIAQIHPRVLAHLIREVRAHQPGAQFLRAVISVDGFTHQLIWQLEMTRKHTASAIDYAAFPDGAGFCHGQDHTTSDDLAPAPGIPVCGVNLGLISFTS